MGIQMVLGGSDLSLMISAGKEQATKLHSLLEKNEYISIETSIIR
jgi:hypothetical protein